MVGFLRVALAAAILALSSAAALADDWVAVRLRGAVLQLVDGAWQRLERGDIVPDSRVIRTLRTGNVEFQRGAEHVTLGADTQIQIYDEIHAKPFTTVKQYFGSVTVEAEVRDVQHFAVQTHFLAAVVKGTRFTVTADGHGANVTVERGAVFVQDKATKDNVTVTAGQSASVGVSGGKPEVTTARPMSFAGLFGRAKSRTEDTDKPGKLKTGGDPAKPGKPGKADEPGTGKPAKDDKSNNGKSGDDKSNNGKSGDNSGSSGKGKTGADNPGKGKSDDGNLA